MAHDRNVPYDDGPFPEQQEATFRALEHAILTHESITHRLSINGDNYHISQTFTVTPTQGSAYVFIDNSMTTDLFGLISDDIKVSGGNVEVYVYDEPDLDETTFQSIEFVNTRSDVIPGPDQNAYFGYDNDVSITDTGRIYDQDFIKASTGSVGTTQTGSGKNGAVSYIIGPSSSAMLEVRNISSNDIEVSVSASFHAIPPVPELIENN